MKALVVLLHKTLVRIIHHAVEPIQAAGPPVAVAVVHRVGRHSAIWNQLPANLRGYLLRGTITLNDQRSQQYIFPMQT